MVSSYARSQRSASTNALRTNKTLRAPEPEYSTYDNDEVNDGSTKWRKDKTEAVRAESKQRSSDVSRTDQCHDRYFSGHADSSPGKGEWTDSVELKLMQVKAAQEEERWRLNFEFQWEQAATATKRWSEEAAVRRQETELREELAYTFS